MDRSRQLRARRVGCGWRPAGGPTVCASRTVPLGPRSGGPVRLGLGGLVPR